MRRPNQWRDSFNHERQSLRSFLRPIPSMPERLPNCRVLCQICYVMNYANIGISQCFLHGRCQGLYVATQKLGDRILRHTTTLGILVIRDSKFCDATPKLTACSQHFDGW